MELTEKEIEEGLKIEEKNSFQRTENNPCHHQNKISVGYESQVDKLFYVLCYFSFNSFIILSLHNNCDVSSGLFTPT